MRRTPTSLQASLPRRLFAGGHRLEAAHADTADAAGFGLDDLDIEPIDLVMLAHRRHATEARQQEAADRLEAVALDIDLHQVGHLFDVHAAAEQERAVAFVDDPLDFDVVLVANFADDLFEQVFNADQSGRPAVFIDD